MRQRFRFFFDKQGEHVEAVPVRGGTVNVDVVSDVKGFGLFGVDTDGQYTLLAAP